jgi:hypothetical protein
MQSRSLWSLSDWQHPFGMSAFPESGRYQRGRFSVSNVDSLTNLTKAQFLQCQIWAETANLNNGLQMGNRNDDAVLGCQVELFGGCHT